MPRDPAFEAFGQEQLKHCKIDGDWGGSNADMARAAVSTERCFLQRASLLLRELSASQRREALGGTTTAVSGDAWYADWARFARLTTELMVRMEFTSGSTHVGGTMLIVMRPSSNGDVARRVLYWLHSLAKGDPSAFAKHMADLGHHGKLVSSSLSALETRASRYLGQVGETTIPEFYPTHLSPLYGGDWRRVVYDVRELRELVPLLARRICRSSAELAVKLGGPGLCLEAASDYLYAQVGALFSDAESGEESSSAEMPPGIDAAYRPYASATYESCEVDERGKRVGYEKSLRCLKATLSRHSKATGKNQRDSAVNLVEEYLAAQCALEVAPGTGLDNPMARPLISEDECRAVSAVRASYFIDHWAAGDTMGPQNPDSGATSSALDEHFRARAAWGARVKERLPKLTARYEAALASPATPPADGTWSTASKAEYKKALESIALAVERADRLAAALCSGSSVAAAKLGAQCTAELNGYWLSYAYIPGMRWEGETEK